MPLGIAGGGATSQRSTLLRAVAGLAPVSDGFIRASVTAQAGLAEV